jgi:hypothetical protein
LYTPWASSGRGCPAVILDSQEAVLFGWHASDSIVCTCMWRTRYCNSTFDRPQQLYLRAVDLRRPHSEGGLISSCHFVTYSVDVTERSKEGGLFSLCQHLPFIPKRLTVNHPARNRPVSHIKPICLPGPPAAPFHRGTQNRGCLPRPVMPSCPLLLRSAPTSQAHAKTYHTASSPFISYYNTDVHTAQQGGQGHHCAPPTAPPNS